jgi:four helix bundle protein
MMRDYRNLEVWRRAHQLTLRVYRLTKEFPDDERFGLISQLRRATVSIPANIAEGYGRYGDKEFRRFLGLALGSSSEVSYMLLLSRDLQYIRAHPYDELRSELGEIQSMLSAFGLKLERDLGDP